MFFGLVPFLLLVNWDTLKQDDTGLKSLDQALLGCNMLLQAEIGLNKLEQAEIGWNAGFNKLGNFWDLVYLHFGRFQFLGNFFLGR